MLSEQLEYLNTNGYVVIPNVISETLSDETLSEFQAFHAHCTGQQFEAGKYNRSLEFKHTHGIIEFPSALAHVDFVNRVRNHPSVQSVFQSLYHTHEPIIMGMDRINYQASAELRGIPTRAYKAWWHVDQSWETPNFQNVQGYVDIVGSETDEHGGLVVLTQSHLYFEPLALAFAAGQIDSAWDKGWHRLNQDELDYYFGQNCRPLKVKCPKGGMVLWDSRTVHMNRPNHHSTDERLVIYTCGFPSSKLTPTDFKRREQAFQLRRATSAWPDARHIFPEKPQWFDKCGKYSTEPQRIAEQWIT
jgi:ectoine hydroxylase-related dioxygenase (phytanoyl-CoA dioxygenase family)